MRPSQEAAHLGTRKLFPQMAGPRWGTHARHLILRWLMATQSSSDFAVQNPGKCSLAQAVPRAKASTLQCSWSELQVPWVGGAVFQRRILRGNEPRAKEKSELPVEFGNPAFRTFR